MSLSDIERLTLAAEAGDRTAAEHLVSILSGRDDDAAYRAALVLWADIVAKGHLESPEVRTWRAENPDATAQDIFDGDWSHAYWPGTDPLAARKAVVAAIQRALDEVAS